MRFHVQAGEVFLHCLQPRGGNIKRGNVRFSGDQLGGFAAGGGAEVEHFPAFNAAQRNDRQRGGKVLHPPAAVLKTGQFGDAAGVVKSDAAAAHQPAAEFFAPVFGIRADGDVERRFLDGGLLDGGDLPPGVVAAKHFLKGRREEGQRWPGGYLSAVAADFAQYGVDEAAGIFAAFFLGQFDIAVDGGVVGRVKVKDFDRAEDDCGMRRVRPGGDFFGGVTANHAFDEFLPPKRRHHQPFDESRFLRGKPLSSSALPPTPGRIERFHVNFESRIANVHVCFPFQINCPVTGSLGNCGGKYKCESNLTLLYFCEIYYSLMRKTKKSD